MLLLGHKMNNQRYSVTEDRIDLTLYECFEKGALAKFFENEDKLKDWIDKQNLSSVFVNKNICRDGINWFIKGNKPKWISEIKKDEIYKYLESAVLMIKERNQLQ